MAMDGNPQLLAVVVDVNPVAWQTAHFAFEQTIESLLAFLNAFSMLNYRNQLAVFASHLSKRCPGPTAASQAELLPNCLRN